jgi:predicted nuclease of predicted toxin-antitoxin system
MELRLYLDESVPSRVAEVLRKHGIDATSAKDEGLLSHDDNAQLAHAASDSRVLVTHDQDFLRISADNANHHGIIFIPQTRYSFGDLVFVLSLACSCLDPSDVRGRVEFL